MSSPTVRPSGVVSRASPAELAAYFLEDPFYVTLIRMSDERIVKCSHKTNTASEMVARVHHLNGTSLWILYRADIFECSVLQRVGSMRTSGRAGAHAVSHVQAPAAVASWRRPGGRGCHPPRPHRPAHAPLRVRAPPHGLRLRGREGALRRRIE